MNNDKRRTLATVLAISMLFNSYNYDKSKNTFIIPEKFEIVKQEKCVKRIKKTR